MSWLTDSQWERYSLLRDELQTLSDDERASKLRSLRTKGQENADVLSMVATHFQLSPELDRDRHGQRIDKYTLIEPIAHGGMGVVYRAHQTGLDRDVALKLIDPTLLSHSSDEAVRRFKEEIKTLAKLDGRRGIVSIHDGGTYEDPATGETPYCVMQLLEGAVPITAFVREHELDIEQRLTLFVRVCEAVDVAHSYSIIHRDLKPANVLVDREGEPFVIDFGLAQVLDPWIPQERRVLASGTPAYMSPEHVTENAEITFKSDVYALGLILYELLTERRPYEVPVGSPEDIQHAILTAKPPPIGESNGIYKGTELEVFVAKALAKDQHERCTVIGLKAAIERYRPTPYKKKGTSALALSRQLGPYVAALGALLIGLFQVGDHLGVDDWKTIALISAVPLLAVLLFNASPTLLRRYRRQRLRDYGFQGRLKEPGYFRLRPYQDSEQDKQRFTRADNAHYDVFDWISRAEAPLLYLSGRSGTGKSSLLYSFVLPKVQETNPPWHALVIRSFRDPIQTLVAELLKPGVLWKHPPTAETDPLKLLKRACKHVRSERILIVFDQFEELLILRDDAQRSAMAKLLTALTDDPLPNLTVLLVIRSDYLGQLRKLPLPQLREDENWKEISPFTELAARGFLDQSGLQFGPRLLDDLIQEAGEIEETKGLIRPITLNMVGVVLSRMAHSSRGYLPRRHHVGELLQGYLRSCIDQPDLRDHAPAVLRPMLTEAGTKQPRTVNELASLSGFDATAIRGCLLRLGNDGIIRHIEEKQGLWEISHDFVARLLSQVLARRRIRLLSRIAPWVAPVTLATWLLALFIGVPYWQHYQLVAGLNRHGGIMTPNGAGYQVVFNDFKGPLDDAAVYLGQISNLWVLDLGGSPLSDLKPLASLTALRDLDLSGTGVTDLEPLLVLVNLQRLDLQGTPISDLEPLKALTNLQKLALDHSTAVSDLRPLANLTRLEILTLSSTGISDLEPLAGLTELRELDSQRTEIYDLRPLANLTRLQRLYLSDTPVAELTPLADLINLRELNLWGTNVSSLEPLANLYKLENLKLSETEVSDLTPLAELGSLRVLELWDTRVSDLTPLKKLTNLQKLVLWDTKISREQIESLKKALPRLQIE